MAAEPTVQVVKPERGGMECTTNQPGTVRALNTPSFSRRSRVSCKTLNVDRGSRVKKGSSFWPKSTIRNAMSPWNRPRLPWSTPMPRLRKPRRISSPRGERCWPRRQSKRGQAVLLKQKLSERDYRKKEYVRIAELVKKGDVEERLADEEHDNYLSAEGSVHSAEAGIETAAAEFAEATAAVEKAKADLKAAQAGVDVSEANLDMAKVFVQYTKILSPYDGVVIFRGESVHPGTFVRSAAEGTGLRFTVARDDQDAHHRAGSRPRRPYCKVGDPATVTFDLWPAGSLRPTVSRIAESEDLKDRTMRVEIDSLTPDHVLRDGMFGRAEILLEKLSRT